MGNPAVVRNKSLKDLSSNFGKYTHLGYNSGPSILASTEIIYSNGKITPGPHLAEGRYGHCQISYEQITFIIGKYIPLLIFWI